MKWQCLDLLPSVRVGGQGSGVRGCGLPCLLSSENLEVELAVCDELLGEIEQSHKPAQVFAVTELSGLL